MLIGKAVKLFNGQDIIDTLTNADIAVTAGSLGAAVPLIDAEGDLYLDIDQKDLTKVKSLLAEYLVS